MSMYDTFKMDERMEQQGILLDYGSFRVTVARAGGTNARFRKVLEAKSRPYRRAIETETIDNEVSMRLLREVYATAVVLNWETKSENDDWVQGIEAEDGGIEPFSYDNVVKTLEKLPDLFQDIQQQAQKMALFRAEKQEQEAGN